MPDEELFPVDLSGDEPPQAARGWVLAAAAAVVALIAIGGVLLAQPGRETSSSQIATPGPETVEPEPKGDPTSSTAIIDESAAPDDPAAPPTAIVETAPGQWRPPEPAFGESLMRVEPAAFDDAQLADGRHFGILHGVVDAGGVRAVVFSRGVRLVGDEAERARAEGAAVAGGDEWPLRHNWWTPEWGVGTYIFPDFDLPVLVPVEPGATITIYDAEGPWEVRWSDLVAHADGAAKLPYYWTGHAFVGVVNGAATHIENMWTP